MGQMGCSSTKRWTPALSWAAARPDRNTARPPISEAATIAPTDAVMSGVLIGLIIGAPRHVVQMTTLASTLSSNNFETQQDIHRVHFS